MIRLENCKNLCNLIATLPSTLAPLLADIHDTNMRLCVTYCYAYICPTNEVPEQYDPIHFSFRLVENMTNQNEDRLFRHVFSERVGDQDRETFFTAQEILEATTKWSQNDRVRLVVSRTPSILAIVARLYVTSQNECEKEAFVAAFAAFSLDSDVSRRLTENGEVCGAFLRDTCCAKSQKLVMSIAKTRCIMYANNLAIPSLDTHKDLAFLKLNLIVKRLEAAYVKYCDFETFRQYHEDFLDQIYRKVVASFSSQDWSNKCVENYVLFQIVSYLDNRFLSKCLIKKHHHYRTFTDWEAVTDNDQEVKVLNKLLTGNSLKEISSRLNAALISHFVKLNE